MGMGVDGSRARGARSCGARALKKVQTPLSVLSGVWRRPWLRSGVRNPESSVEEDESRSKRSKVKCRGVADGVAEGVTEGVADGVVDGVVDGVDEAAWEAPSLERLRCDQSNNFENTFIGDLKGEFTEGAMVKGSIQQQKR